MTTLDADDFELGFGAVIHAGSEFDPSNAIRTYLESTQGRSDR